MPGGANPYSREGGRWPVKVLHGIPDHLTYRQKLESKWRRKGYVVRFG